jgi:putative endonuclease
MRVFHVYILASRSRVLYTGITSNIARRMFEHKNKLLPGFTSKYSVDMLVYCEEYQYPHEAIMREKQIKGYVRKKKIQMIESMNPEWEDLSADWCTDEEGSI